MSDVRRRLKKAEDKLNLGEKHMTINVTFFGQGGLPPDHTDGNITVHYVAYEDVRREKALQCEA